MRVFVSLSVVLVVVWALSAAVVAQKPFTADDLDKLMKKDGPAQMALVRALSDGNATVAKTQLTQLRTAFVQSEQFWVSNKRTDAVQFTKAVFGKLDELDKIVAQEPYQSAPALAAARGLATACNDCHKVYRVADDNGQFMLKPGSIPGL